MDNTKNLTPSVSRDEIERSRSKLINSYLGQLATAAGTEATKERRALYCRALKDIGEPALRFAFEEALKHLGQFLPSIEQLRAWSEQYKPVDPIAETRRILARDDKPPDWQALGRKAGITPAEIAQWLEDGKAKQRAKIAELEADPEWRRQAGRFGVPGYQGFWEYSADGSSEVPRDPEERKAWAHKRAVTIGIVQEPREPGDEQ